MFLATCSRAGYLLETWLHLQFMGGNNIGRYMITHASKISKLQRGAHEVRTEHVHVIDFSFFEWCIIIF